MDNNVKHVNGLQVKRVMENLEKNHISAYYAESQAEVLEIIDDIIDDGHVVGLGGSMTLFELGIIDHMRKRSVNLLDRYREGITLEERDQLYRQCFSADAYLASTNAVTEEGTLYNVDGTGNRVAAMIWGPKKVIVVCGTNKIVKDEAAAVKRNKEIAAPANAKRLNLDAPCTKTGYCVNCNHKDRICSAYTMIAKQRAYDRMHVILVEGAYGY